MKEKDRDLLRTVLSFIFPPIGVFDQVGLTGHFWLNLVLTFFTFWIGGFLHALYVIWKYKEKDSE